MLILSPFVAACSHAPGLGALSLGPTDEREATVQYIWTKRGSDFGELARAYCVYGSARERHTMQEAYTRHATPARIEIHCPAEDPRGF